MHNGMVDRKKDYRETSIHCDSELSAEAGESEKACR